MQPTMGTGTCVKPARPALTASAEVMYNSSGMEIENSANDVDVPMRNQLIRDLVVSALTCDLSRVATMMLAPSRSDIFFNFIGINNSHHDLSHDPDSNTASQMKLVQINTWYATQVAALVTSLKAVKEGAGTMFDNTIVFWCNELGIGNNHSHTKMPLLIAAGKNTGFKTGQAVTMPDATPHNRLLLNLIDGHGHHRRDVVRQPQVLQRGPDHGNHGVTPTPASRPPACPVARPRAPCAPGAPQPSLAPPRVLPRIIAQSEIAWRGPTARILIEQCFVRRATSRAERREPGDAASRTVQLELPSRGRWGGKRAGAGRKLVAARPSPPHRPRAGTRRAGPCTSRCGRATRFPRCGRRASSRSASGRSRPSHKAAFRVVHFSVQSDHVHLVVEGDDPLALVRGVQGLAARCAKARQPRRRAARARLEQPLSRARAPHARPRRGAGSSTSS